MDLVAKISFFKLDQFSKRRFLVDDPNKNSVDFSSELFVVLFPKAKRYYK